ncbi:MAG TPA: META domain-containing protein [Longimicrobium sp.]|nr:META domain-containing protein [Longimicrobium sp.]
MMGLVMRGMLAAAVGLVMAACSYAPEAGPGGNAGPLEGTEWRLEELNGRPAVPLAPGGAPTLAFAGAEPRASGNGGCNAFNGPYTRNGSSLDFGPLVSTRRACLDEAGNAQETAYLGALESTTRYAVYDDLLVLYAGEEVVARLRRTDG